jgi:hypothetical protein
VAGGVKVLGHTVPEPRVGGQAMNEHERSRTAIAESYLDVQLDPGRDDDTPLDHPGHR